MNTTDTTITVYAPVERTVSLAAFPEADRLVHFAAVQLGPEHGYKVDMEFRWRGGALYGADIPVTQDPYDIAFMVREDVSGDWLAIPDDLPLWAGGDWTLAELGPHIRRFVEKHFLGATAASEKGTNRPVPAPRGCPAA